MAAADAPPFSGKKRAREAANAADGAPAAAAAPHRAPPAAPRPAPPPLSDIPRLLGELCSPDRTAAQKAASKLRAAAAAEPASAPSALVRASPGLDEVLRGWAAAHVGRGDKAVELLRALAQFLSPPPPPAPAERGGLTHLTLDGLARTVRGLARFLSRE